MSGVVKKKININTKCYYTQYPADGDLQPSKTTSLNHVSQHTHEQFWNLPSFSGVPSWCLSVPLGIVLPL